MSIQLSVVNTAADTFQNWIDKHNAITNTIANSVMTANTNANGATTTGNVFLTGIFGATTISANTLRGGNVQSSANLTISSNALFTGDLVTLGANITINTSSVAVGANVVLTNTLLKLGNTTINAVINSTAMVLGPNLHLTGSELKIGNSTVNAIVNTSGVSIGGVAMPLANNKTAVAVDGSLVGTGTRINFSGAGTANVSATVDAGNSQVNVIITSSLTLANGAGGANTYVLYNDSQQIGGQAGFTYDETTNNVLIGNTLTISTTVVNSSIFFMGNSTINATSNLITKTFTNSTVTSSYGTGGANVGANVSANTTALKAGSSTMDTSGVSTGNVTFTGTVTGGNVIISTSRLFVGNSTVNAIIDATSIVVGSVTVNGTSMLVGANLVVNTTFIALGNTTVSWGGNSSMMQVTNATHTSALTPAGVTAPSGTFSGAVSADSYTGNGISNTLNYWANTAGKVVTTDVLIDSYAYVTLTDAATISWDMGTGINFSVTFAGNRTLANPTNIVVGRSGVLRVNQDGGGGRTIVYGNNYIFPDNTPISIGVAAGRANYLAWHAVSATRILITTMGKNVTT